MVVNVFVLFFSLRIFCSSCSLTRNPFFHCFYFRLNNVHVQSELLKQIPRLTDVSLPTNYMDWKLKQMSSPRNTKDISRSIGHRDRGFVADEPNYMLVRNDKDDANPRHMGILDQYRSYFLYGILVVRFVSLGFGF